MARIPYIDPANPPEPVGKLLDDLPPLNLFLMMAHAGQTLKDFVRLGNTILVDGELDPVVRELAILRVAHISRCDYLISHHRRIARELEIPFRKVEALERGAKAQVFEESEQRVLAFVDDVVTHVRARDVSFQPLADEMSVRQLQELVLTVGYYMMVARFLETFDVDVEEDERPALDLTRIGSEGANTRMNP